MRGPIVSVPDHCVSFCFASHQLIQPLPPSVRKLKKDKNIFFFYFLRTAGDYRNSKSVSCVSLFYLFVTGDQNHLMPDYPLPFSCITFCLKINQPAFFFLLGRKNCR